MQRDMYLMRWIVTRKEVSKAGKVLTVCVVYSLAGTDVMVFVN